MIFKNRALMFTMCLFLLWWVLAQGSGWIARQMIDSLPTSNTNITAGSIIYTISLIELVLRLIGTYLIARYFLNQPAQKTKRFEGE